MNHYTQVLSYLKELAESDSFVNTVTQGDMSDVDINKMNVFNLVHIDVLTAGFTNGQTVTFDIEILSGQIRDSNKQDEGTKFYGQDNEVDNLNETLAVLNRIWFKLLDDFTDQNIRVEETASLNQVTEWNKNLIDGWLMTFSIELPNTTISLCDGVVDNTVQATRIAQAHVLRVNTDQGFVEDFDCLVEQIKELL
jgi:hypothetical protein